MTPVDARPHIEALSPDAVVQRSDAQSSVPVLDPPVAPATDIARLWRAAGSIERTFGASYLRDHRLCWDARPFPPSVRWLDACSWAFHFVRPEPPEDVAGLVVYGYRGIADRVVASVQVEAVSETGDRIPWPPGLAPRVSLAGSRFDSGRQRFEVLEGDRNRLYTWSRGLSRRSPRRRSFLSSSTTAGRWSASPAGPASAARRSVARAKCACVRTAIRTASTRSPAARPRYRSLARPGAGRG